MEGETKATVADIERDNAAWRSRCQDLLMTVGASTPEDHDWVQEARWLLDNWPWTGEIDGE